MDVVLKPYIGVDGDNVLLENGKKAKIIKKTNNEHLNFMIRKINEYRNSDLMKSN